jgi:glycerol-3-phosphate dehydrogenase
LGLITDDARLTLAVLLDAPACGADIRNRRAVTVYCLARQWVAELDELDAPHRGAFINAAGPWIASVDAMTEWPPRDPARARQPSC